LKVKLDTVIPKINVKMGEWGQGGLNIKKTVSVWGGGVPSKPGSKGDPLYIIGHRYVEKLSMRESYKRFVKTWICIVS
jgi:hypothetical protein